MALQMFGDVFHETEFRHRCLFCIQHVRFFRHAEQSFGDGDPANGICCKPKTTPWPAGSNYRAISWHRFNFPAKYTGDVQLANCLFQTCIAFTVKCYKNTVESRLITAAKGEELETERFTGKIN